MLLPGVVTRNRAGAGGRHGVGEGSDGSALPGVSSQAWFHH